MRKRYPGMFTFTWPWYCLRPTVRRRGRLEAQPLSRDLEPADDPLRLLFFGDLMVTKDGRVPAVDEAVAGIVSGADLVIGNCEAPVAGESYFRRFTYRMSEDYLRGFLEALGVRPDKCVLNIANNHAGDAGPDGPAETVARLEKIGVAPVGTPGPVTWSRGGVTLAIVAWTQWLNRPAEGIRLAPEAVGQPWRRMREFVDCLVATPHWDYEFSHFPKGATQVLADRLMDEGIDLIVGHHPHVLQHLVERNGSLCMFSTGNLNGLYFPWTSWPVRLGCLFEIRLVRNGPRRGRIAGYTLHPTVQEQRKGRTHILPLDHASPKLRAKCEERLGLLFLRHKPPDL